MVEHWTGQTTYDSVEIGICKKGPYQGNSSWKRGGSAFNRHELSPYKVYERLFAGGIPAGDTHLFDITMALEKSMLDAVMDDTDALNHRDPGNRNAPRALLTAVRAVGLEVPSLGQADGDGPRQVTETISGIET